MSKTSRTYTFDVAELRDRFATAAPAAAPDNQLKGLDIASLAYEPNLVEIKNTLAGNGELSLAEKIHIVRAGIKSALTTVANRDHIKSERHPLPTITVPSDKVIEGYFSGRANSKEIAEVKAAMSWLNQCNKTLSYSDGDISKAATVAAIACLNGQDKAGIQDILTQELTSATQANKAICVRDHQRDGITIRYAGGEINIKDDTNRGGEPITSERIANLTGRNLTGEQMDFILTTQHQGIVGQPAALLQQHSLERRYGADYAMSLGDEGKTPISKTSEFCTVDLTDPERVTIKSVTSSGIIQRVDREVIDLGTSAMTTIETDITNLKGDSFTLGLATASVSPKLTYEIVDPELPSITLAAQAQSAITTTEPEGIKAERMIKHLAKVGSDVKKMGVKGFVDNMLSTFTYSVDEGRSSPSLSQSPTSPRSSATLSPIAKDEDEVKAPKPLSPSAMLKAFTTRSSKSVSETTPATTPRMKKNVSEPSL